MSAHPRTANVLLLIAILSICVLLAEILVRVFLPQRLASLTAHDPTGLMTYDPVFGTVHVPHFSSEWARGIHVSTNSIGLRDREFERKTDNEIRILSLGDSFAFGYGVELSDSYPKILEKMLAMEFPDKKISVINGAVPGYNTRQQILMFEKLFSILEPDMVIATFVAGNDVHENAVFHGRLRQRVRTPVGWLGRHSHLMRMILRAVHPANLFLSNRWGPNIDYTIDLLADLRQEFAAADIPYLMLVIPARHQVRPEVHLASKVMTLFGLDSLLLKQNRRVIEHFRSAKIPYVDLYGPLSNYDEAKPVYFEDDSHMNGAAHGIIADEIYLKLQQKIASRP